jgi:hypothetical protein
MAGLKGSGAASTAANSILGSGTPATVYAALFSTLPTAAGGGTELSGGNYARVAITNNSTNWPAAVAGLKSNGALIDFGTVASANWGTANGAAIVTTSSGALGANDVIIAGLLGTPRILNVGDAFKFNAGAVTYQEL